MTFGRAVAEALARSILALFGDMLKRYLIAVGLVPFLAPSGFSREQSREQSLLARVTVYWASGGGGSDKWTRRHVCSTGARLKVGHCAVDPRRIPYGSRVTLPDATLIAVDTGAAVVSRKAARRAGRTELEKNALVIDRFFETKQQALSWARRNSMFMSVRISPPDSRQPSNSRLEQSKQIVASNVRQQLVAAPAQSAATPRRSLEDRPMRSAMYAR
jgi:3D (Asp-Asp-Asp) domain-containing protein